jgi:hypothetical protein
VVVGLNGDRVVGSEVAADDGTADVDGFSLGGEQAGIAVNSAAPTAVAPANRRVRDVIVRTLVDSPPT